MVNFSILIQFTSYTKLSLHIFKKNTCILYIGFQSESVCYSHSITNRVGCWELVSAQCYMWCNYPDVHFNSVALLWLNAGRFRCEMSENCSGTPPVSHQSVSVHTGHSAQKPIASLHPSKSRLPFVTFIRFSSLGLLFISFHLLLF